nr:GTPase [Pseudoclavibacter sp. Marseille-Q3772]
MSRITLDDRIRDLQSARDLAAGRLPAEELTALDRVLETVQTRRSLSSEHTVVGFFGATGSGKSSLFNAVVGEPLAHTHVRRPTTSEPLAAIWQPDGAAPLLDWLQVRDRRVPATPFAADASLPLILLDLPDFDSVRSGHREIATRLAGQVDVLIWVVDPQKYADAALHRDFIRPLASHSAVTAVVLNQIDTLPAEQIPQVVDSLTELVRDDGLDRVEVLAASARSMAGVPAVRERIAKFARQRVAATERLTADIRQIADRFVAEPARTSVSSRLDQRLRDAVTSASGTEQVSQAVARSYRKRAGQATGWPVTSWLLRFRPDPLRRLHLGSSQPDPSSTPHETPTTPRSSRPPLSAGQQAALNQAVRSYTNSASEGLPEWWAQRIRDTGAAAAGELPDAVDLAIARTDLGAQRSWWWPVVTVVQVVALLAALVGVGWYLLIWAMRTLGFGFGSAEIPTVEGWPVPGLFIALGVLLGIVLGLVTSLISAGVARRRARRARRRLRAAIAEVVDAKVIAPVQNERSRAAGFAAAMQRAGSR